MTSKAEFERVALPHLSRLYNAALYLTKDNAEAEDLVQATYLRAFCVFDQFEAGTNCRAWLLSILQKLFINRYHQKKREPEIHDWKQINRDYESMVHQITSAKQYDPENLYLSRLMVKEIETALRELPEEYRIVIVLVDIEDLSYEEAAKVMDCPVGTVRSKLSRGRRLLQLKLRDYALKHHLIDT